MTRESWIVVGTDFSDGAELALAHAIEIAAAARASVALVHAYLDPDDATEIEALRATLATRLDAVIASSTAAPHGVHVKPVLRRGPVWEKLQNVATDMGADRIVIGSRGGADHSPGSLVTQVSGTRKRSVFVIEHRKEDER